MAAKQDNTCIGKKGGDKPVFNIFSSNQTFDMAFFDWDVTRRQLMLQAGLTGLLLAFPWADRAFAALPPLPAINFQKNKTGDGIVGPYGEVRIFNVGGEALPAVVSAVDGSALMDITGRSPFVRFGTGTTAITLTSGGVQFGDAKPEPWNADVVKKLIAEVVKDRKKARGAMLLRSTLHTSYPVAVAQSKSKTSKDMAAAIAKGTAAYGLGSVRLRDKHHHRKCNNNNHKGC